MQHNQLSIAFFILIYNRFNKYCTIFIYIRAIFFLDFELSEHDWWSLQHTYHLRHGLCDMSLNHSTNIIVVGLGISAANSLGICCQSCYTRTCHTVVVMKWNAFVMSHICLTVTILTFMVCRVSHRDKMANLGKLDHSGIKKI